MSGPAGLVLEIDIAGGLWTGTNSCFLRGFFGSKLKFSTKRTDARLVKLCFWGGGTTMGSGDERFYLYSSSDETEESVLFSSSELSSDFSSFSSVYG